jgi:hypothetical protein
MNINIPGVALAKAPPKVAPKPKFAPEYEEKSGFHSARGAPPAADGYSSAFDEQPAVGAASMRGAYASPADAKHASGKKVAKVEAVHHAAYDDRIGHDEYEDADNAYSDAKFEDEQDDSNIPYTERVIKPKSNVYEEALGGIDDDPNTFRAGGNAPKAQEQFPEGEHPLDKVPNHRDLPAPEALSKIAR